MVLFLYNIQAQKTYSRKCQTHIQSSSILNKKRGMTDSDPNNNKHDIDPIIMHNAIPVTTSLTSLMKYSRPFSAWMTCKIETEEVDLGTRIRLVVVMREPITLKANEIRASDFITCSYWYLSSTPYRHYSRAHLTIHSASTQLIDSKYLAMY